MVLNRFMHSNSIVNGLVNYGTVMLHGVLNSIVACIMMDHRSLNMFNYMCIIAKLTVLLNLVVNIQITSVSRLIQLAVGCLNLTNLALMLQNLAPLLSQLLQFNLMQFPVLLFFMRVEEWLDFEQVTVKLKLLF